MTDGRADAPTPDDPASSQPSLARLVRALLADERFRFLLVGGVNTVVGYALFALFELTMRHTIGDLGSLYLSYAIAIVLGFVLHRRFTFRVAGTGRILVDFARFCSVYVVSLAVNTAALPLLVEVAHWPPLAAQAVIVVGTTLISFFGHKFFSFRRTPTPAASVPPDG